MIAFFSGSTPQGRISYYMPSKPQIELAVKLSRLSHSLQNCKVATVERLSAHLAAVPQLTMLSEHAQANAIVLAYPQGAKLWIQDFKTIEESYVPMWEATFQSNRPLNYDQDFRVWTREGCSLEQDPMASNWR
ncbi:MAG: hypothetical protein NTV34_14725 [Proteobacteria bacterium]|nr:hypothetical protein [Pseudomonadota bacterium]